jgi:hypothetical protein
VLNLLTNALIHGPGAAIAAEVRHVDGMAELAVRDSAPYSASPPPVDDIS